MPVDVGPVQDALIDPEATEALARVYGQSGPQAPTLQPPAPPPTPQPEWLSGALGALTQFGQGAQGAVRGVEQAAANVPGLAGLGEFATGMLRRGPLVTALGGNPDEQAIAAMPEGPEKQAAQAQFQRQQMESSGLGLLGGVGVTRGVGPLGQRIAARAAELNPGGAANEALAAARGAAFEPGTGAALRPGELEAKQLAALRAGGATEEEIAAFRGTVAPRLEAAAQHPNPITGQITTAEGVSDAGDVTRALQAAFGQEGRALSDHPALQEYLPGALKGPKLGAGHGGDIGLVTRAVMDGSEDAIRILGDDVANTLIQNKTADILRRADVPEDVVRRALALKIARGEGAGVEALSPKDIAAAESMTPPPPTMAEQNTQKLRQVAATPPAPADSLHETVVAALRNDLGREPLPAEIAEAYRGLGYSAKEAQALAGAAQKAPEVPVAPVGGGKPPRGPTTPEVAPTPEQAGRSTAQRMLETAGWIFTDMQRAALLIAHLPLARQAAPLISDAMLRLDAPALGAMLRDTALSVWSEGRFQQVRDALGESMRMAGFAKGDIARTVLDVRGIPNAREEFALQSFLGQIPGISNVNRAFPGVLNTLRVRAALDIAAARTFAGGPLLAADSSRIVDAVLSMSGRGPSLPGGNVWNGIFFGQRFLTGQFTGMRDAIRGAAGVTSDLIRRQPVDPVNAFRVRAFGGYIATAVGVLKIAEKFGLQVDLNPESRDYGMIVLPDGSRVDPFADVGSLARLFIREAMFAKEHVIEGRPVRFGQETGADMAMNFLRGKLNPGAATAVADVLFGKTATGEQTTPEKALGELVPKLPIFAEAANAAPPTEPTVGGVKPEPAPIDPRLAAIKMLIALAGATVKNNPRRVEYDGLGAAAGEAQYETGHLLQTYAGLVGGSSVKWHGGDPVMTPPSQTIGAGANQIRLDPFTADRYVRAIGLAREEALGALVASPKFQGAGVIEQRTQWDRAVTAADAKAVREFLAKDILQQTNPRLMTAEAVDGFVKQANAKDKAYWLATLDRAGKLTPDMRSAIDTLKDVPADQKQPLRVDEYLRAAPLVHQFLSHVPYGTDAKPYGTPDDWAAVDAPETGARARESVRNDELVRAGVLPSIAAQRARLEVAQSLTPLQRNLFLNGALIENPERRALLRQSPLIERFLGPGGARAGQELTETY